MCFNITNFWKIWICSNVFFLNISLSWHSLLCSESMLWVEIYVEVMTHSIWKYDLIWKWSCCRSNYLRWGWNQYGLCPYKTMGRYMVELHVTREVEIIELQTKESQGFMATPRSSEKTSKDPFYPDSWRACFYWYLNTRLLVSRGLDNKCLWDDKCILFKATQYVILYHNHHRRQIYFFKNSPTFAIKYTCA